MIYFKNNRLNIIYKKSLSYCKKFGSHCVGHDYRHTTRVLDNALFLIKRMKLQNQINFKVIIASSLLHDISRSYGFCGLVHGLKSFEIIKLFLKQELNFNLGELDLIKKVMTNHCIEDVNLRKTLEEKIIYDADKLDGFGVRGLWRLSIYTIFEREEGLRGIWNRIVYKMPERRKNLHFKVSKMKSHFLLLFFI
ncbi:hypothetical protein HN385_00320 [archaeon]|jgi:HD superfamily phosphodiesterase|nr:hypothetical protein [archaeon]MBT3451632.1 hypothetical protein [archaeon]MBT6869653.1 hypothetical protein [archaeon]MBT7192421.1 hypothetical protein [archaeon]MBT7380222.1 hypothetical protein [archaeon]